MAQPTLYNRDYSFTAWSNSNPSRPHPGSQIDAEFDSVADTVEQIIENIGFIQRDDGFLANQSVHPEAIRSDTWLMVGGWNPTGDWAGGTVYAFKDVVVSGSDLYVCLVAHTAGADFATDLALSRWMNFTADVDAVTAAAAAALVSETAAAASAAAAATSATNAATSESNAATSATEASDSATAAASSATAAAASATSAAASAAVIPATAGHALEYLRIDSGAASYERLTAADVRTHLGIGSESIDHVWWTAWPTPPGTAVAYPARFGGRVFVGGAVLNDSTWWDGAPPGAPVGFTDLDWLGQLARASYNGGDGIGLPNQSDVNYSQMVVLADDDTTAITHAGPHVAITAAVQSLNCLAASSPRVFNGFAVKNHAGSLTIPIWCYYGEAHRVAAGDGNVYAMELEVRNSVAAVTNWTPYATSGVGTIALDLGAGCGLSSTGQFAATAAINIHANPMTWGAGILILDGAIGAFGVGSTKPAIMMPYDNRIQWFASGSTIAASLHADNLGNFYATPNGGELIVGGNVNLADDTAIRFGSPGSGDAQIIGSAASDYIRFLTAGAEVGRFTSTGLDITGTLDIDAGGNVTWDLSTTPTHTLTANLDASTAYAENVKRVGDVVTVSGRFDADTTAAANTDTQLTMTVPIASTIGNVNEACGVAVCLTELEPAAIYADGTGKIVVRWKSQNTNNRSFTYTYTYRVN